MVHARILIGAISIVFLIATFEFVRKRHLREEYAILWVLTSFAIAVLSLWPGLIELLSRVTGFYYITSVVAILFVFMVALLMHYSIVISKIKELNKELVQRYALLELKIREIDQRTMKQPKA